MARDTDHTLDADRVSQVTELFKALSNPVRVAIVRELSHGDRAVHELVEALDVAQPRVSEHLAILRGARLVRSLRDGRNVRYHLMDEHVAHIVEDAVTHTAEPAQT
ncbi:MAG: helix-turn-helix transcriptional regulator [Nitriliruptoraceae bacterium]|nr:helix-turn-helix transcriptional regulator [Nitriliruptoraceae bacterium]